MPSFKALIENSPDVISLISPVGEVLYASASSAKIFGYRPEELVGRNTFDLIHPDDRDQSRKTLENVLAWPPGPEQVEARIRQKDGEWCWVESTISNLLDDHRIAAIVMNHREISASRAAREQTKRHVFELARANDELVLFAHSVAHDLREPLRTVSMFSDLMLKGASLDDDGAQAAHFVIQGLARMSALLDGLHAFALGAAVDQPHPVDLQHVVVDVLKDLRAAIHVSGAMVTFDPLPQVQGNEKQLLRVFQNLIVNAIKYRGPAIPEIHISAEQLGTSWVVRVKDNGIGVEPKYHEKVFQLLKRLHGPEIPGAGLGLAICKKIVETLGGSIWVESEPGAGATFCFTIAAIKP
jgi:PAS domain S-box-containing protein